VCLRKSVCVLYLCVLHRGFAGARGELLAKHDTARENSWCEVNVVCLRKYDCVFKVIYVCVVFLC